jgi:hypothetical protein
MAGRLDGDQGQFSFFSRNTHMSRMQKGWHPGVLQGERYLV